MSTAAEIAERDGQPDGSVLCPRHHGPRVQDDQDDQGHGANDGRLGQDFARNEELSADQQGEQRAPPLGSSPLDDQELVEDEEHERGERDEHQVQVVQALTHHVGGEPVEEPSDERGRPPRREAASEDITRGRRRGHGKRQHCVEAVDRTEQQRDRRGDQAEQGLAGVGEQVHPVGVVPVCGEERIVPVQEGERRPGEEPHVHLGVEAARLDQTRRARRPHAPVSDEGDAEVHTDHGQVRDADRPTPSEEEGVASRGCLAAATSPR